MNYEETVGYIHSLGNFKRPAGLERIKAAMDYFSNPQNGFCSVHIAGTNGKGSTAAMLARIFKEAGLKTGLFISPYIIMNPPPVCKGNMGQSCPNSRLLLTFFSVSVY